MTKTTKILLSIIIGIPAFIGVAIILLVIYYFPVIDRLAIRPCHYYPNMFIDCQVVK